MKSKSIVRPVTLAVFSASFLACAALRGEAEEDSRWVHPLCQSLPVESNGPFVELADGSLMTIDAQGMRVSKDDGKIWSEAQPVCEGLAALREGREPATFYVVRTRGGALVIVYLNSTTYNFSWDRTINQPKDDCRLEIWAIRSLDGGKTWTKPVVLARQKDGQLSYPYCLERRPGELWVIAGFAFKKRWQEPLPLRLKINEEEFLNVARKGS